MNISSKRFHKLKYKIKNQSAKKYKNKHKRKKGGYLSKKKNKKYNLKNKSMKIKRKNQKGGSTPSTSIKILNDYTGLVLNNIDITLMPIKATLSDITNLPQESQILNEIKSKQQEIKNIENKINEIEKLKDTEKDKLTQLSRLDEKLEKSVRELQNYLVTNIKKIQNKLKIDINSNQKKELPALIDTIDSKNTKIFPFYSFLFYNEKIKYNDINNPNEDKDLNDVFLDILRNDSTGRFKNLIKPKQNTISKLGTKINEKILSDPRRIIYKLQFINGPEPLNLKPSELEPYKYIENLSDDVEKTIEPFDLTNIEIKNKENKNILNIDIEDLKNLYNKIKPVDLDITLLSEADQKFRIKEKENYQNKQIADFENKIEDFVKDNINVIQTQIANVKTKIMTVRKELKKRGLDPKSLETKELDENGKPTGKIVFSDADGNSVKFKDCGKGMLQQVDDNGQTIGECMKKEDAKKLAEKENEKKKNKDMRDKLGMNLYLPQTELSEKESLYYNINLNQKRENVFGQIMPNTSYNDYNHNLYGPAQSTTLGWLLHGPDNLGLDKVEGLDENIKIDERGQYVSTKDGKLVKKKDKKDSTVKKIGKAIAKGVRSVNPKKIGKVAGVVAAAPVALAAAPIAAVASGPYAAYKVQQADKKIDTIMKILATKYPDEFKEATKDDKKDKKEKDKKKKDEKNIDAKSEDERNTNQGEKEVTTFNKPIKREDIKKLQRNMGKPTKSDITNMFGETPPKTIIPKRIPTPSKESQQKAKEEKRKRRKRKEEEKKDEEEEKKDEEQNKKDEKQNKKDEK